MWREEYVVGFEILTATSMKMAVFWVVADYTALQHKRQQSSEEYLHHGVV
jgi:hypothetical protein